MDEQAFQRAEALLALRRPQEAWTIAGDLVAGHPDDARIWALVGRCQLAAGAPAEAVTAARRALALAPDHAGHLVWASNVLSAAEKGPRPGARRRSPGAWVGGRPCCRGHACSGHCAYR